MRERGRVEAEIGGILEQARYTVDRLVVVGDALVPRERAVDRAAGRPNGIAKLERRELARIAAHPAAVPRIVLAVTRDDVASYVLTLTYVYVILIFVRVIMSWLPRMPYNRILDMFLTFVRDVVDPYLNLFRRFLPLARLGPAAIDLSPMLGTFLLIIVGQLVANAIAGT